MANKGLATGMPIDISMLSLICEPCIVGKQTKTPVPQMCKGQKAVRLLEKVHSDITGP